LHFFGLNQLLLSFREAESLSGQKREKCNKCNEMQQYLFFHTISKVSVGPVVSTSAFHAWSPEFESYLLHQIFFLDHFLYFQISRIHS
jgi:hypothetical protein